MGKKVKNSWKSFQFDAFSSGLPKIFTVCLCYKNKGGSGYEKERRKEIVRNHI